MSIQNDNDGDAGRFDPPLVDFGAVFAIVAAMAAMAAVSSRSRDPVYDDVLHR